jgi:hypothetical protein
VISVDDIVMSQDEKIGFETDISGSVDDVCISPQGDMRRRGRENLGGRPSVACKSLGI